VSVGWFCPKLRHRITTIAINLATEEGAVEGRRGFDVGFGGGVGAGWAKVEGGDERGRSGSELPWYELDVVVGSATVAGVSVPVRSRSK
jgi:hypothetical protein